MGLNTIGNLTSDTYPVPNTWIFEKILNLSGKLNGDTITILSVFNVRDKVPSMKIYYSDEGYRFKDFSSGNYGDGIELYSLMAGVTRIKAKEELYELWKKNTHVTIDFKYEKAKKNITNYVLKPWSSIDVSYWKRRQTSSKQLEHFNIKPLKEYTLEIIRNNTKTIRIFNEPLMYGYFTKENVLYKIYKPGNKTAKFIEVFSYLQGEDQLTYNKPYLIIMSSLKDIVGITNLKYNDIEYVAADSENILIPKEKIDYYKSKYKQVSVLFDNDKAGLNGMIQYKETYNIPGIIFNVEKDVDECIVQHGLKNTRLFLTPILKKHYELLRANRKAT
jgi:hypothetical protein